MKTVNNPLISRQALLAACGVFLLGYAPCAHAADPVVVPPPVLPMPALQPVSATPAPNALAPVAEQPGIGTAADMNKTVTSLEDKAAESAKALVKRLDNVSDPLTIEDLNSARQTVARIEAMIDVEKHLLELSKLRNERNGGASSAAALVGAIPASALTPPSTMAGSLGQIHSLTGEDFKPRVIMSGGTEVVRILGAEGKYIAVLKMGNGDKRSVKVGDEISGGTTVRWISASAVGLDEKGETHTLHVKDVDTVYSAMR